VCCAGLGLSLAKVALTISGGDAAMSKDADLRHKGKGDTEE
jgi:hypothetical protein